MSAYKWYIAHGVEGDEVGVRILERLFAGRKRSDRRDSGANMLMKSDSYVAS